MSVIDVVLYRGCHWGVSIWFCLIYFKWALVTWILICLFTQWYTSSLTPFFLSVIMSLGGDYGISGLTLFSPNEEFGGIPYRVGHVFHRWYHILVVSFIGVVSVIRFLLLHCLWYPISALIIYTTTYFIWLILRASKALYQSFYILCCFTCIPSLNRLIRIRGKEDVILSFLSLIWPTLIY